MRKCFVLIGYDHDCRWVVSVHSTIGGATLAKLSAQEDCELSGSYSNFLIVEKDYYQDD